MAERRAAGDTEMSLDESAIRSLTASIIQLMETKCIRLNGSGTNWRSLFSEELGELTHSASPADLELRVSKVLARGGLSHVAFFHESAQRAPARYAINATFCSLDTPEGRRWVFEDVHEGGPAHVAGVRPGDVLLEANGAPIRPPTFLTFGLGTDPTLTIRSADDRVRQVRVVLPKAKPNGKGRATPPMAEPTSVTARTVSPGVGYVRVAFFPGVNGQRFAGELDRALAGLSACTRLIIDLRGNLGGFVGSLRLMSYLTPERIPVGYSLTRTGEDRKLRPEQLACIDKLPKSKLDMLKMAFRFMVVHRDRSIRLVSEGLGPKPFHGRIVMLVNEHTLSAGEMVAAFAAENGLATLVGTRTGGQVLGGANFSVGHGFILRLPAAGWYTWRGSIVEGRGVSPNVEVPLSLPALQHGRDNQLEAAVATVNTM
jgi:carboxyl-terminal processing protease